MPRFHFNIHDGKSVLDREGTDLRDLPDARRCALHMAGMILAEAGSEFWNGEPWRMEVTSALGLILFTLTFLADDAASTRGH